MPSEANVPELDPPPLAAEHIRAGRYGDAVAVSRERLADAPDDVGALRVLAHSLLHLGHSRLAVLLLEQARKTHGDDPTVLVELGAALAAAGSTDSAAEAYRQALVSEPGNTDACFGLLELGRSADAEEELRSAIEIAPDDPVPHFALANLLLEGKHDDPARRAFERAVELNPGFRRRHARLGAALAMWGRYGRAERMYRWGLALDPTDPELRHMADALAGTSAGERSSAAYVTQHYDSFADTFEETLVERLGYRGHEVVVAAVHDCMPERGALSVLDAGCGTGLCGPLLRPLAGRLVGVDLSPRMLELAAATGSYDELRQGDLEATLNAGAGAYDLVVAADVLIYFGRLDALFRAASAALRPGGLFAFTFERHDGDGLALRSSGRHAHSPQYVRDTAAEAGLTVRHHGDFDLRSEAGRCVDGAVAVLERPAG